ncbi:MAG: Gfo/Idh/MocA family oxidoreductase [Phycisphaerae bacterium]|nr:Gfo/Idh/MocA family oxidoreductase [Phycisphaerae bacterium]
MSGLTVLSGIGKSIFGGPSKKYCVAVIGHTGRGDYGHGLDFVWNEIEQAQVVAVADPDPKGRSEAVERVKAPRGYADYRQMLDKEKPQIVSVAPRWLDAHRDMVLACAEQGCHVFLEKPICQDLVQADEMVAAFEKRNLKLAIAHQTRYSPALAHARKAIDEGLLGDILELRGRGKEDRRGGGEDLMVLGTHVMDLMRFFSGDPQECFAQVRSGGHPVTRSDIRDGAEGIGPLAGDEIVASYRFSGKTMGYFASHQAKHGASERYSMTIFGSKGILTTTFGAVPEVWFTIDPSWQFGRSKPQWRRISSEGIDKLEPLSDPQRLGNRLIALDLIRAIENDTHPLSSIYDGRAALEMILAVYESHRRGGPVRFPLQNRKHPLSDLNSFQE